MIGPQLAVVTLTAVQQSACAAALQTLEAAWLTTRTILCCKFCLCGVLGHSSCCMLLSLHIYKKHARLQFHCSAHLRDSTQTRTHPAQVIFTYALYVHCMNTSANWETMNADDLPAEVMMLTLRWINNVV